MALAKHTPQVTSRTKVVEPTVVSEPRKHEIYDHNTTPLWSLDAFISGAPWEVKYYRQRLGKNDTPKKLDPNSDPAYQSYDLIDKMELLVQNAISPSYRDRENLMEVTGSAIVFSTVMPNVDDYIVAQSNLARLGLFRVTNVSRKQHERESVFLIEYTIEEEITEDTLSYKDLERKVVKTFVFSKQRMIENRNPLILKESYAKLQNLHYHYKQLVERYFQDFFSVQSGSLQIPGQTGRHIDPYVLEFLLQIVSMNDSPIFGRTRYISLNNDPDYTKPTLWSILIRRNEIDLGFCERNMGKINPRTLTSPFFARSGSYAGADWVVRPQTVEASTHSASYVNPIRQCFPAISSLGYNPTKNAFGETVDYEDCVFEDLPQPLPAVKPVVWENGYVFGESFYQQEPESVLEVMVLDYIRHQPLRLEMLSYLVSLYPKMQRLEQFYFGPILMVLIKESERGAHV